MLQNMLDIKVRDALEQVIDQFVSSFPTTVSSLRKGIRKADLQIENENALGYAHSMTYMIFCKKPLS
jgi:hypothetical protein